MSVVEVANLKRRYGDFVALSGISFDISPGEIVGLLGPNGAGKSTTMKILTGYLAPTAGMARVCGHNVLESPTQVRSHIGYLPESAPIYDEMNVGGYLQFIGRARRLGAAERARAVQRVVEECGLVGRLTQRISTLSKGYRQRVGLAQALMHEPTLLILDEPTSGLDPNQKREMRAIIRRVGETRTVLLSTHILSEVELTCDRVLIIHQGNLVADGATEEVITQGAGNQVTVGVGQNKVLLSEDELLAELSALPGVERVDRAAPIQEAFRFTVQASEDVRGTVFQWAVRRGIPLLELSGARSNLEDVFQRLTGSESHPASEVE